MTLQEWFELAGSPTKVAFAREVGSSPQWITDLCKGRKSPGLALALNIARRTGGRVPCNVWIEDAMRRFPITNDGVKNGKETD
jgi:DNA-binding XRE family transcriptional regulator